MLQPIDVKPPDSRAEPQRLFDLQAARRWELARSTAPERRERLRRLKAALERHRAALAEESGATSVAPPTSRSSSRSTPRSRRSTTPSPTSAEWMRSEPVGTPVMLADTASEIRWEPKGQVLILAPWNYPVFLVLGPLADAVAAGNTVILKPSEKVPETNRALRQILTDAFPEAEVAMVEGDASVAEALLALPFNHILFTGSTKVGKLVMAAAAKTLASVTLELGGKSPAYVAPGANLERAARAIAWGSSSTPARPASPRLRAGPGGAARGAGGRAPRIDGGQLRSRGGWARNGDLARLVDPGAFARVKGLLDEALQRGARVAFGGTTDAGQRFIAPHGAGRRAAGCGHPQEEIFGPVLPVVTYRTEAEARWRTCAAARSRWRSIRSGRAPRPAPPSPGPPRAG